MKKLIILILFLFPCLIFADTNPYILGSGVVGSDTEDSCTGGLELTWHMEDVNLANETGCSAIGDSIWAPISSVSLTSGDKSDFSQSLTNAGTGDYYVLNPTTSPSADEGKIVFDFIIDTYVVDTSFMSVGNSDGNLIYVQMRVADTPNIDFRLYNRGITILLDANASEGTWYRMTYQWDISKSNADQKITIQPLDSSNPRELTGAATTQGPENDVTAFVNPIDEIKLGNRLAAAGILHIDNFKYHSESGL